MARPKNSKNHTKKYRYDDFWLTSNIYKGVVISFSIRFDYENKDNTEQIDISDLRNEVERMFNKEFEFIHRKRHLLEIEMSDYLRYTSGHCGLTGYFLKEVLENTPYDTYDDYIIEHSQNLIENHIRKLFKEHNLTIIEPQRYTKKECTER